MLCTVARTYRGERLYLANFKLEVRPRFHWTAAKDDGLRMSLATAVRVMNEAVVFCPSPYLVDKKGRIIAYAGAPLPANTKPRYLRGEFAQAYGGTLRALAWFNDTEARNKRDEQRKEKAKQFTPIFTPPLVLREHKRSSDFVLRPHKRRKKS